MDYVSLGILKSQGFTKGKIRGIIVLQYLLAELIGMGIGSLAAIPLERVLDRILMRNTAILPDKGLSLWKGLMFYLLFFIVTAAVTLLKTEKISKISPVRAISGGKEVIYFDSRLHLPIHKKALSASLAFRQFTSGSRRYIGTVLIVDILTFFMLSANLIGNILNSRTALETMGMDISDVKVIFSNTFEEEYVALIEDFVEARSHIEKKYYMNSGYMSVNGEDLRDDCYQYPEYINAVRVPLYDNEIVISEMITETLELKMGEEVFGAGGRKVLQKRLTITQAYGTLWKFKGHVIFRR